MKRPVVPPPDGAVRKAVLLAIASWTASGLHLWFLLLAVGAPPWAGLGAAVGGFALATVISSLALIVPDGWGVRELTLTAALSTVLPGGLAAAAAIASRLVCVVAELTSSAVVLAWSRARTAKSAKSAGSAQSAGPAGSARTARTTPFASATPAPDPLSFPATLVAPLTRTAPMGEEARVHP